MAAHHWLGYLDGEVDDSAELRGRLVALVRQVAPEAVVAPDPTAVFFGGGYVNHRDHRPVGWAAVDAVAPAAANPHYFPGYGPVFQVTGLYLPGRSNPTPGWTSPVVDLKAAALACHTSQLGRGW